MGASMTSKSFNENKQSLFKPHWRFEVIPVVYQPVHLDIVDCEDLDMKQKKDYYLELDLISVGSLMVAEWLLVAAGQLVVDKSVDVQD